MASGARPRLRFWWALGLAVRTPPQPASAAGGLASAATRSAAPSATGQRARAAAARPTGRRPCPLVPLTRRVLCRIAGTPRRVALQDSPGTGRGALPNRSVRDLLPHRAGALVGADAAPAAV